MPPIIKVHLSPELMTSANDVCRRCPRAIDWFGKGTPVANRSEVSMKNERKKLISGMVYFYSGAVIRHEREK
ncbi:hypothetical protein HNY73_019517 [Argiope bruennichi]|uniref:Uncharacterized protein n=1 Tax=Argiope bruennichi TaxID=94029 RepID=A0A8T0E5C0_ARGBR|nr:hypothetical protein HNY73_019517 [Argiope bruennichi]